jgi:hypothetical protein
VKAGTNLMASDSKSGAELLLEAMSVIDEEERQSISNQIVKDIIGTLLRYDFLGDCVACYKKQNDFYIKDESKYGPYLYKNFLSVLVIRFQAQEYKEAQEDFAEFSKYVVFCILLSVSLSYVCLYQ